jgi:hypothetical protein
MPRRGDRRGGKAQCTVCASPEHIRADWLLAAGATCRAVATKFKLSVDAVERHRKRHLSREFLASVRLGPWKSEEELRRLTAENSTSVLENLMAIYGALTSRFLAAHESGSDPTVALLSKEMHRISKCARRSAASSRPRRSAWSTIFSRCRQ